MIRSQVQYRCVIRAVYKSPRAGNHRGPRRHAEKAKAGSYGDELSDQSQEVPNAQVDQREPSPERPKALEDQFGMTTMRCHPKPHRHFLNNDGHREGEHDKWKEEANAELRARGSVRQHTGPIVLAQHDEDSRPNQQPQQAQTRPRAFTSTSGSHAGSVVRTINILVRDDGLFLAGRTSQ